MLANRSRLSKTLEEVLADKGAVGYFIQFLEAHGGLSVIKFWLDVESFRATAVARSSRKAPDEVKLYTSHCESDKLSLSTDSGSVFESPLHSSGSTNDISGRSMCTGISDEGQETIKHILPQVQSPNISLTYSESLENRQPSVVPNSRLSSDSELSCSDNYILVNSKSSTVSKDKRDSCSVESAVAFDCYEKVVGTSKNESDNAYSSSAVCSDELVSQQISSLSSKDQTTKSLSVGCSQLTQVTVDDALRIFNTYVSHEATCPVRVPDVARDRVVAAICSDVGMVDAECFTELQEFVFQTMEKE